MHTAANSDESAANAESTDAAVPKSYAASAKSDAPDGWLGDSAHAGLTIVKHASSALLSGLNHCRDGPALSGIEAVREQQSTRDTRFLLPKRQKAATITPATGASGANGVNNGSETKQARETERTKAGKLSILKRQLAVDGEDAGTSDDE